ncbi:MAG TPA: AAA family ATPase [Candidatus Acidoferrales bacterium]|nr:AAA family ATPase [Candidatus Acidoferrales bacterium]
MLTVAIASADAASSAHLLASLQQTGVVKTVQQWTMPGWQLGEGTTLPDVVLLDLGREPEAYFALGAATRKVRPAIKLVACAPTMPPSPQLMLEAMRSGVQDFVGKPVSAGALKEVLLRFSIDVEGKAQPFLERLIVVMGSKGGVGATTVAVNLGVQLATYAKKRVALLDFARPLGNVHLFLDLQPKFNVRDAAENIERLDSRFFAGLLTHHATKLEVLGGATHPEEWQAIAAPSLERLVNVAQNSFDIVLLDIGSQLSADWTQVLRMARMVLIVSEANVPSLWTLQRRLLALSGMGLESSRARVIINRWHKGDEEVLKSIQKDISRPVFACLPNDFRKASQAINLGTPLMENHNNVLTNQYRQIAAQLVGMDAGPVSKKSFFSFPAKR